jgi:hypothetical protein
MYEIGLLPPLRYGGRFCGGRGFRAGARPSVRVARDPFRGPGPGGGAGTHAVRYCR